MHSSQKGEQLEKSDCCCARKKRNNQKHMKYNIRLPGTVLANQNIFRTKKVDSAEPLSGYIGG